MPLHYVANDLPPLDELRKDAPRITNGIAAFATRRERNAWLATMLADQDPSGPPRYYALKRREVPTVAHHTLPLAHMIGSPHVHLAIVEPFVDQMLVDPFRGERIPGFVGFVMVLREPKPPTGVKPFERYVRPFYLTHNG